MTENTADTGKADAGSESALATVESPDEHVDLTDDLTGVDGDDGLASEFTRTAEDAPAGSRVPGTGAVSGGFGFAGLALAVVSLTTNWTSGIVVSRGQYTKEITAGSSGLSAQQQLDLAASGWQTQGWWALAFAAVAVLCGVGALFLPRILRRNGAPGWAKAAATSAVIVGLVGVILAVLTIVGVFGGHLTAPSS